jgi:sec-independent protein translocase protein TatA
MFDGIGLPELLIILVIVVLLFGVGRVEKVGKELGSTISAFRKGLKEGDETDQSVATAPEGEKEKANKL